MIESTRIRDILREDFLRKDENDDNDGKPMKFGRYYANSPNHEKKRND